MFVNPVTSGAGSFLEKIPVIVNSVRVIRLCLCFMFDRNQNRCKYRHWWLTTPPQGTDCRRNSLRFVNTIDLA